MWNLGPSIQSDRVHARDGRQVCRSRASCCCSLSACHRWLGATQSTCSIPSLVSTLRVRSCGPRVHLFLKPQSGSWNFACRQWCCEVTKPCRLRKACPTRHACPWFCIGPEIRHSYAFLCGSLSKQCRRYRVAVDKVDDRLKIEKCR